MSTLVVEQKPIAETSQTEFWTSLRTAFRDGWRIVPGTVVISTCFNPDRVKVEERCFAVVEK